MSGLQRADYSAILSSIRGADYAHPGEEEAIERALCHLTVSGTRRILDLGCGLGGTSAFIHRRGWGSILGVDVDPASVSRAQQKHPDLEWRCADGSRLDGLQGRRFDLVLVMNVAYLIDDKESLYGSAGSVADEGAELVVSDFCDPHGSGERVRIEGVDAIPHPLEPGRTQGQLERAGWKVEALEPLDEEYRRWYQSFNRLIVERRQAIERLGGEGAYRYVHFKYSAVADALAGRRLGGLLIRASRSRARGSFLRPKAR